MRDREEEITTHLGSKMASTSTFPRGGHDLDFGVELQNKNIKKKFTSVAKSEITREIVMEKN